MDGCPGCGRRRHPLLTCDGKTADEVAMILLQYGGVYVPLYPDLVKQLENKHRKGLFE